MIIENVNSQFILHFSPGNKPHGIHSFISTRGVAWYLHCIFV